MGESWPADIAAGRRWRAEHGFGVMDRETVAPIEYRVLRPAEAIERDAVSVAACRRLWLAIEAAGGSVRAVRAVAEAIAAAELIESLTLRFRVHGASGYAAWWNDRAKGGCLFGAAFGVRPIEGIVAWVDRAPWPPPTYRCPACGREGLRRKGDGGLYAHKRAHGPEIGGSCNGVV